jgi:hypothetical protein
MDADRRRRLARSVKAEEGGWARWTMRPRRACPNARDVSGHAADPTAPPLDGRRTTARLLARTGVGLAR